MRKVIVVLLILTASTAVFSSDIALRIGHGAFLPGEKGELGLHALGGVSLGLTKRVELNLEVISPLVRMLLPALRLGTACWETETATSTTTAAQ